MADTAITTPISTAPASPKKASDASAKKRKAAGSRAKLNHPPTSDMVNNAIKSLKERGGSSLQAIKKYLAANYKVDVEKLSPFIKKYIKTAVVSGGLVQTKGKGASGSFKLAAGGPPSGTKIQAPKKKSKTSTGKRAALSKSPKRSSVKIVKVAIKKSSSTVAKKTIKSKLGAVSVEKKNAAVKPKSHSKAKKTSKVPTKKPKAPKPKKAARKVKK